MNKSSINEDLINKNKSISSNLSGQGYDYENIKYESLKPSDINDETQNSAKKTYTLYRYRWVILFFFAGLKMAYGITSSGYTPIFLVMDKAYGVDANYVVSLVLIYNPAFLVVNFLSNFITGISGLAAPVRIAVILGTLGAFLRLLVPYGFIYMFLGQLINALGMPFVRANGSTLAQ